MKKQLQTVALLAATLPLMAAPALAAEPLDPRALSLGGHYTAYPNADVNGTLGNPALLGQQRGFFYVGPNLGLSIGNNAVGANDVQSLIGYGQYMAGYFQYSQAISDASTRDTAKAPDAVAIPDSVKTLTEQGLSVGLGLRTGLVGLKLPVPSFFGVRMPVDPPKPKPVSKKPVAPQAAAVPAATASMAATGSVIADASGSVVADAATGSLVTSTGTGMITSKGKLDQPTKSVIKREEPQAPAQGGLAWGALGVRAWGDGRLDLTVASPVIMKVVTNFPTLDQTLQKNIKDLKDAMGSNDISPSDIAKKVLAVRDTITSKDGFGVFMKDPAKPSDDGARTFTIAETNRAYGTAAVTLSQPIPFPSLGWFPKARATVGGAFKVFGGPGTVSAPVQTAAGSSPLTVGAPGTVTAQASINLSEPLDTLSSALDEFSKDYSKASEMQKKLESFGSLDYNKALGMTLKSRSASNMGTGVDVGAVVDFNDSLSMGASVYNAAVFWPGSETNFKTSYNGSQFAFTPDGTTQINFTDTEPTVYSLGATYRLPLGFNLMGDVQQSMEINPLTQAVYSPALQAGLEWNILNFLYARAGARFGGKDPMYGAGVGMNLFLTKLDLAVGTDPDYKSLNLAVSTGIGF
ncbi:MAG TPA: hypothetical protein V6D05_12675 [Stenomitos sp.]